MRLFRNSLSAFLLASVIFSCKTDVTPVEENAHFIHATVQPVYGNEDLFLDSTYTTPEGYDIQFTDIKFYMQDIRSGDVLIEEAALFDYRERGVELFKTEGSAEGITYINANLGVESEINHLDPSAVDNESMLNIMNSNDMHWGWNPGYIFVKVEAKADTIQDGNPLFSHNIVFHIGLDVNMQTVSINNFNWLSDDEEDRLKLQLDMQSFLSFPEIIDVKNEFSSHSAVGQEVLSLKVIQNFRSAISLY